LYIFSLSKIIFIYIASIPLKFTSTKLKLHISSCPKIKWHQVYSSSYFSLYSTLSKVLKNAIIATVMTTHAPVQLNGSARFLIWVAVEELIQAGIWFLRYVFFVLIVFKMILFQGCISREDSMCTFEI
jgi:hypothetical protein